MREMLWDVYRRHCSIETTQAKIGKRRSESLHVYLGVGERPMNKEQGDRGHCSIGKYSHMKTRTRYVPVVGGKQNWVWGLLVDT